MALIHHASLVPSKLELVAGWITAQPFWPEGADPGSLERAAAFRFDDPAGKVGIETLLVRCSTAGDVSLLQIPLTYREAPLDGGEPAFIGTMQHSVLGTRWVYDATGDPVYLAELVRTVVTGDREVELYYEENGVRTARAGDAHARGSGHPEARVPATPASAAAVSATTDVTATVVDAGDVQVRVVRNLAASGDAEPDDGDGILTGEWEGVTGALLAVVHSRRAVA